MSERMKVTNHITASPEVAHIINNVDALVLAPTMPPRMEGLLNHLKGKMKHTLDYINATGKEVFIAGPQWCRENAEEAGQKHADVIHAAYGPTYALPNKDPKANKAAIENNELDMFLLLEGKEERAIGTACTVVDNGRDELGRTASIGHAGNSLIQDLRIVRWLTDEETAQKTHTLFATLRTAPDREIGEPELMRGGQGVCHIWSEMPNAVVTGFGPLYKKHGALETFVCVSISREEMSMPPQVFVAGQNERAFVSQFTEAHGLGSISFLDIESKKEELSMVAVHVPPKQLGITEFVHADLSLENEKGISIQEAVQTIEQEGSPFVQITVPIDTDTRNVQRELLENGFQGFQVIPALDGIQSAALVFGKVMNNIDVISTFWQNEGKPNPFWGSEIPNGEHILWNSVN